MLRAPAFAPPLMEAAFILGISRYGHRIRRAGGAVRVGAVMDFAPGIHFGLSEDDYFSVPALSASGVKNLRMSPLDFWARSRWLNPAYEDDNEEPDSFVRILGKAYHKRILEGAEAFAWCYAAAFNPDDHKGALDGADDIKEALRKHKEAGANVKLSGKKADMIANLLELEPTAKILDVLQEIYEQDHEGKTFLPQKYLDKIELAAAMIEKDPQLSKAFIGGMAEVSIFWVCPTIGVPCKARLDYLKPKAIVDLKTFANKNGYPLGRAIDRELGYNRYPIQSAWYYDASDQIAALVKDGLVFNFDESWAGTTEGAYQYLRALKEGYDKTFLYVFQQKGVAPVAIGRTFGRSLTNCQLAQAQCEAAKQTYRQCADAFGADPWLVPQPISAFDDATIPALWE